MIGAKITSAIVRGALVAVALGVEYFHLRAAARVKVGSRFFCPIGAKVNDVDVTVSDDVSMDFASFLPCADTIILDWL